MQRFSILTLAQDALAGRDDWTAYWRNRQPSAEYEVAIVGAGGHGLATAYHLARTHGIHDVVVLEKDMIAATCAPASGLITAYDPQGDLAPLLAASMQRYGELSRAINFNIMLQRQGIVRLGLDDLEMRRLRRAHSLDGMAGASSRMLTPQQARKRVRRLASLEGSARPLMGAMLRGEDGSVNRNALLWAFARAADSHSVHLVPDCTVTGLTTRRERVVGVETDHGPIKAGKVVLAAGPSTRTLALTADIDLPLMARETHTFVTEPVTPVLDHGVVVGDAGFEVHQAHTGELVMDFTPQSQSAPGRTAAEDAASLFAELFPSLSRLRLLRHWRALRGETPDGLPIVGESKRKGLYLSCGWARASLTAVPASGIYMAELVAGGKPAPQIVAMAPARFAAADLPARAFAGA